MAEARKLFARLNRLALRIMHSASHEQGVARVLIEQFVRLDVQRVRGDIPDDLIDTDDITAIVLRLIRLSVVELDQEDRTAADRRHIDRPA